MHLNLFPKGIVHAENLGGEGVAMEHPMNTIQRIFHPGTFAVANDKLKQQYGKDWDEVYPQDKYYQGHAPQPLPQGHRARGESRRRHR